MGADIFDSYVASAVAVMVLGASIGFTQAEQLKYTVVPLVLCMLGIVASLIGISLVRVKEGQKPGPALNRGTIITTIIFAIFLFVFVRFWDVNPGVFWAGLTGLIAGVVIGITSDYFTNDQFKPVQETARVSSSGSAINIITGYSYGLISIRG